MAHISSPTNDAVLEEAGLYMFENPESVEGYGCYSGCDADEITHMAAAHYQHQRPDMPPFSKHELRAAVSLAVRYGTEVGLFTLVSLRPNHIACVSTRWANSPELGVLWNPDRSGTP